MTRRAFSHEDWAAFGGRDYGYIPSKKKLKKSPRKGHHIPVYTPSPYFDNIAKDCRILILETENALGQKTIGSKLGGFSIVDLCADNLKYPLRDIRQALELIGYPVRA